MNPSIARYPVMSPSSRVLGGLASRQAVDLKYMEMFTLDPGSATDSYVFNLNGMYDPNSTGGGHQPSNFDFWMTGYNRYCVHTVDVKLTVNNTGPDQSGYEVGLYGFFISQTGSDVSSGTPFQQIAEQPYVKYTDVGPGSRQSPYVALTARIPIQQWLGMRSKEELFQEAYTGNASANPTRNIYMECFYCSPNGNTVANPAYFKVEIVYHAWMFLPRQTTYS